LYTADLLSFSYFLIKTSLQNHLLPWQPHFQAIL
jgi:hypothetical protein